MKGRLQIYQGEDKQAIIKLRLPSNDPFDLEGVTKISAEFYKTNRTILEVTNSQLPASNASAIYMNVSFVADYGGLIGNNIILQFDNVHTIDEVVQLWNDANPLNTVSHNGTGTLVLPEKTVQLSGGAAAYYPIEILDAKLGTIKMILMDKETASLRLGESQTVMFTMDFGDHPTGIRKKARLDKRLDIYRSSPI